jgi:hypothetical protein
MAIIHDPETGWGFTLGTQPYVGYATREEACEALYDAERGKASTDDLIGATLEYVVGDAGCAVLEWIAREVEARITVERHEGPDWLPGLDYKLGDWTIEVLDEAYEGARVRALTGDTYMSVEDARRQAHNLLALLEDPRVKAAIAEQQV